MADSVSGCGIGRALPRLEDRRFLEGRGAFLDNLDFPTSAHAVVLRSPHGHADILEIDDAAARSAPGVLLLATAADLAAEDLGGIDCLMVPPDCEGRQTFIPPHHLLQGERVRFVGDRIALVVAETRDQARDAVEMIGVEYLSNGTTLAAINGLTLHSGPYAMEAGFAALEGVFSNTVPTDVMRGAGRPEAIYAIERLVDAAAVELGIAPDELRRRNLIPADAFPYTTAFGLNYDSGCFESNLDSALERADWRGFSERRTATEDRGRLAGIALGYYVQRNGGRLLDENAQIRIDPSGFATLLIGTLDTGQGHETTYAQIIADRLGLNLDAIRVVERDTDLVGYGNGTGGSRSMMVGGSVTLLACQRIIDKALTIAAHLLEASTDDIAFADGRFTVSGTDRTLTLQEVAQAAYRQDLLPEEIETGLDERANFRPPNFSFPNGVYVCEVEVDPETGKVDIVRFTAAEDFGTVVNPLLVEGQVHGALAMGFGQAIHERTVFDPDSGQLLSGSLVDYALPRTTDMPPIDLAVDQSAPCLSNPLGAKGAAEGGTVGAPPVVINAILDALRPLGVAHIDMPATPERVWQAIRDAKKGTGTLRG